MRSLIALFKPKRNMGYVCGLALLSLAITAIGHEIFQGTPTTQQILAEGLKAGISPTEAALMAASVGMIPPYWAMGVGSLLFAALFLCLASVDERVHF